MIRVATIALAMLLSADAGAWTVKYTEHCIAAVNRVVPPGHKIKLLSEKFGSDFGLVHVSVVFDKKDDAGAVTRKTLRCEYLLTRGDHVEAIGMLLNGSRLLDDTVELINFIIDTEPDEPKY